MAAMLAAGVGVLGAATSAADTGRLSDAEFNKLAGAAKTPADHRTLAKHYRAVAAEHEAEAKTFEGLAAIYAKGAPGVSPGQAHELSRALRHVAEHSRDFSEAVTDVADVHEGIAQGPLK
jgi:hypothetical protein